MNMWGRSRSKYLPLYFLPSLQHIVLFYPKLSRRWWRYVTRPRLEWWRANMYVGQPPSLLDAVVGVDDAISLARQKHERGNSRGGALRIQAQQSICGEQGALEKAWSWPHLPVRLVDEKMICVHSANPYTYLILLLLFIYTPFGNILILIHSPHFSRRIRAHITTPRRHMPMVLKRRRGRSMSPRVGWILNS